jgi:hypothetical protein
VHKSGRVPCYSAKEKKILKNRTKEKKRPTLAPLSDAFGTNYAATSQSKSKKEQKKKKKKRKTEQNRPHV